MNHLRIGHWTDRESGTGLTVFIPPTGSTVAAHGHGQNTGTMNIHALGPEGSATSADAIVLTGGSSMGLRASAELIIELDRRGVAAGRPQTAVPVVGSAVVYDLPLGGRTSPPADAAIRAYDAAGAAASAERGTVGVGTATLSGAMLGLDHATKGGFGAASRQLRGNGLTVSAWAAANPVGDVIDRDGRIMAGLHDGTGFIGVTDYLDEHGSQDLPWGNATTLVVVAVDAQLDKRQTWLLARDAHLGIAQAVSPSGSAFDGDTSFAIATGERPVSDSDMFAIESAVIAVTADAIRDAVRRASSLHGVRSSSELLQEFADAPRISSGSESRRHG